MTAHTDSTSSWRTLLKVDWHPRNADLALLVLTPIYLALVLKSPLPLSKSLITIFAEKGAEVVVGLYALSIPVIAYKAVLVGRKLGWRALRHQHVQLELIQPYWTLDFLLLAIRRTVVIFASIYLFLHLKHLILWHHRANYDLAFWKLDRVLHFGVQPNVLAMQLIGPNQDLAVLIDWLYFKYFAVKLIVCVVFLMELAPRRLSDSFFLAYALMWLVGGLLYLVCPADGPCYAILSPYSVGMEPSKRAHIFPSPMVDLTKDVPKDYVELYANSKIPTAKAFQEKLWLDRQKFFLGKGLPGVFYGVAAMPSLHVGAVAMLTYFMFQLSSIAGLLCSVFLAIMYVGSIFLQWHYAIDGYAGFAYAVAISYMSLRLPRLFGRNAADGVSQFDKLRALSLASPAPRRPSDGSEHRDNSVETAVPSTPAQ